MSEQAKETVAETIEVRTLGRNTTPEPGVVYNEDALVIMGAINDLSVDMVLSDPPYGVDFQSNMPQEGYEKPKIANDKWEDTENLLRRFFKQSSRVLSEGGVLISFCAGGGPRPLLPKIWGMLSETPGLEVENCLVWDRLDIGLGWRYRPQWEGILVAVKGDKRRAWNGATNQSNVLRYPRIIPKAGEHPTPKPPDLICRLLLDNSNEGDLILDPFCGGGAVPFVCEREKRRWIACDMEPRYAEMTRARLRKERNQLKLF